MYFHQLKPDSAQAWFIDLDTLWVSKAAALHPSHPSGHIFGSTDAVPSSSRDGVAERLLRWQKRYTRMPGEQIHLCSPFRLPSQSPWLEDAIVALKDGFLRDSSLPCLDFMDKAATYLQPNNALTK